MNKKGELFLAPTADQHTISHKKIRDEVPTANLKPRSPTLPCCTTRSRKHHLKFCYVDESGKGDEAVFVLTGIVADVHRMHVTKADWLQILRQLAVDLNKPIDEFHTRHFYRGNGIWRSLDGTQRTAVLDHILHWMHQRNHKVVFSAIDKRKLDLTKLKGRDDYIRNGGPDYWKLGALHLLLSIQKLHQNEKKNKGHTVMIFDQGSSQEEIAQIVLNPPAWSDSFYDYQRLIRKKKAEFPNPELPLSMIVDVPYFADSRHVGMLQVADLFAYLLRHHSQLQAGHTKEDYTGEIDKVAGWVGRIAALAVADSYRWKASGACECSNFFRSIGPEPLLELHRNPPASQKTKVTINERVGD